MMPTDFTGRRFGKLIVLFQATEWRSRARTLWACQCDCGGQRIARHDSLRDGHTKSCGCLKRDQHFRFARSYIVRCSEEWRGLLDALAGVLTRFPQTPAEIRDGLERMWGHCHPRRFWRALRTLVEQGRAQRLGRPHSSEDEIGSVYVRSVPWWNNLGCCIADAAATYAVYELGMRRAA